MLKNKTSDKDLKFISESIRLSGKSIKMRKPAGGPFGAIIVKDGKIIGRGFNRVLVDSDPTAHGEIVAIRNACKNIGTFDLSNCTLYSSCRPCLMCLAAAQWANISKIFYAADAKDAAKLGFRDSVMYKSFKKPNFGTKIKSATADAAHEMHEWHKKFTEIIY